jgi:F0F1-type ATP synthase membrane subunit c/vacuolar-type H+-ATPase subunit K
MHAVARTIRIIRVVLVCSIVVYLLLGEGMIREHGRSSNRMFLYIFTAAGIGMVLVSFAARRLLIAKAETKLAADPDNESLLHRWRGAYIVSYVFSETVAILGFVLRVLGFTLSQAAPFYIAGAVLLLFFRPRAQNTRASALDVATR